MEKNGYLKIISILFFIGCLIGVLCAYAWRQQYGEAFQNYFGQIADKMEKGSVQYGILYWKAVKRVFLCFFLLILCSISGLGKPAMVCFTTYQGFHFAFLWASLFASFGVGGGIYGLAYGFPHGLIYGFVLFFILFQGYKKKDFKELLVHIGILCIFLLVGAIFETFINSWLLCKLINLLV